MRKWLLLVSILAYLGPRAQTTLDTAVNFSVKDITGYTHDLFDILDGGKMVVIDFFSTSCGPCATYAPHIQASYVNFGMNSGNVYFLGISWGDDNQSVHAFDSIHGITYPSVSGTQGSGNQVVMDYNILSYPTVILIMPDRSIKEKHIWPPTTTKIDSVLLANGAISTGSCPAQCSTEEVGWKVWPNPSQGFVNISYTLDKSTMLDFSLIDMAGRVYPLPSPGTKAVGNWHESLDISHLPSGLYLLSVQHGLSRKTIPIIVE